MFQFNNFLICESECVNRTVFGLLYSLGEKKKKVCKTSMISFIYIYIFYLRYSLAQLGCLNCLFSTQKAVLPIPNRKYGKKVSRNIMHVFTRSFRYFWDAHNLSSSKLFFAQIKFSDLWIIHQHWYIWRWCSKKHKYFWYLEYDTSGIKYLLKQKHSFRPQKLRFYRSALNSAFGSLQSLSEFFNTFCFQVLWFIYQRL